jgi:hypothetical protein
MYIYPSEIVYSATKRGLYNTFKDYKSLLFGIIINKGFSHWNF